MQYLGAVRLLKEATTVSKVQGARLTRYAAALQLQDKHRLALVQSSANRNMEVGNYRSAAAPGPAHTGQACSAARTQDLPPPPPTPPLGEDALPLGRRRPCLRCAALRGCGLEIPQARLTLWRVIWPKS